MPEGDTIFRAARTLQAALGGERVTRFETALAQLARADADAPLAGRTVEAVTAVGKHLLMRFSGGLVLRTHQRMNGSWHLYRPRERWRRPRSAMRVVVETVPWVAVGFDLPVAELLPVSALARHRELSRLGPDLLAPEPDLAAAAARLRCRPEATAGEALLDQRALAGVGNVYKSEVLFLAGVHPDRTIAALGDGEIERMVRLARDLLRANVGPALGELGPSYTGGRRTTRRSERSARLWVYRRGGQPCRRCGTPIAFTRQGQGARVTYFCPHCQPAR